MTHGDEYDRDGQQDPECKSPGQARHDRDGDDHGDERLAGVHDAWAEDHADIIEIVSGARHELAGAIANVKFGFHEEQMIEERAAEVEFDVAGDADENPAGTEGKKAAEQHEQKQEKTIDA